MTKGTTSFGKRHTKSHTLCVRCGKRSFHIQKSKCSSCAFPSAKKRRFEWAQKAIRRNTTGTGRQRYTKHLASRYKNNFRQGTTTKKIEASS